jgi:serine/threonine protein kinase
MLKTGDNNKASVKIIDFGLACVHRPEDPPLTAFAGSAFTVAPEVIQRQYGKEVDLWSVGVITYFLLMHLMPFNASSNDEMFKKIQSGIFAYPQWAKTGVTEEAKDFIERLLVVNPKKRMTAKQALSHAWIRKVQNHSDADMSMAVVPYENKKPTDDKMEVQRRACEPEQALVTYNNTLQRKPTRVTPIPHRDSHGARAPNNEKVKHKSTRRPHVGESRRDRVAARSKKESERKLHNKDAEHRYRRRH